MQLKIWHKNVKLSSSGLLTSLNQCKLCDEYFQSDLDLLAHNRQQHQEKKYKCNECPKEFHTQKSFVAHSQIHTDTPDRKRY